MAADDRGALETAIGAVMTQHAICEFLIQKGVIDRAALLEFFGAKLLSWEKTATQTALFPMQMLATMLAGKPAPSPPPTSH